ncbi:hypothetical protein L596_012226 [Steinernema carpocapsae]|uniref:Uncharacterized protein n=1 Tax=Steinernema carpocapsae TaxID=34508 RepID=A0A4U5NWM6_STECR|nr:hypothetical protein L596_012226 [Steinernema carpocapsae]
MERIRPRATGKGLTQGAINLIRRFECPSHVIPINHRKANNPSTNSCVANHRVIAVVAADKWNKHKKRRRKCVSQLFGS